MYLIYNLILLEIIAKNTCPSAYYWVHNDSITVIDKLLTFYNVFIYLVWIWEAGLCFKSYRFCIILWDKLLFVFFKLFFLNMTALYSRQILTPFLFFYVSSILLKYMYHGNWYTCTNIFSKEKLDCIFVVVSSSPMSVVIDYIHYLQRNINTYLIITFS